MCFNDQVCPAMSSFDFPNSFVKCVLLVSSLCKYVRRAQERGSNVPGLRGGGTPSPERPPPALYLPLNFSASVPASPRAGSVLRGGSVHARHRQVSLATCNLFSAERGQITAIFLRCYRDFVGFGQSPCSSTWHRVSIQETAAPADTELNEPFEAEQGKAGAAEKTLRGAVERAGRGDGCHHGGPSCRSQKGISHLTWASGARGHPSCPLPGEGRQLGVTPPPAPALAGLAP